MAAARARAPGITAHRSRAGKISGLAGPATPPGASAVAGARPPAGCSVTATRRPPRRRRARSSSVRLMIGSRGGGAPSPLGLRCDRTQIPCVVGVLTRATRGQGVGPGPEVAAGLPHPPAPAVEEGDQLVEVVAQRLDERAALVVGGPLDGLPGVAARG